MIFMNEIDTQAWTCMCGIGTNPTSRVGLVTSAIGANWNRSAERQVDAFDPEPTSFGGPLEAPYAIYIILPALSSRKTMRGVARINE